MPRRQRYDRLLLGATVVLTTAGMAVLGSASWLIASERYGRPGYYFLGWQAAAAMIGLIMLVACMHLRLKALADARVVAGLLAGSWILLAAAFLQSPIANTHRWLNLGLISVQPSVFARLCLIAFAALYLADAARQGWPMRRLALIGLACTVTAGLILAEPDLGTAVLLLLVLAGMAFVAGMPLLLLAVPTILGIASMVAAIIVSPYRLGRVVSFFGGDNAPVIGWQTRQSLVAIGSGGLFGKGYGAGMQKLFFLPEPHTDFILAITGEELGLLGLFAIIALAALITWRGLRIAHLQTQPQRALLAFGLTFAFAAQTLIHMVVCLGLAPPKGIPLPLVSYGKMDLVITLASVGLLLNLSREVGT